MEIKIKPPHTNEKKPLMSQSQDHRDSNKTDCGDLRFIETGEFITLILQDGADISNVHQNALPRSLPRN